MKHCDLIAALLPRVADEDATPAEVAWVAHHVQDCTCCGILLARERRLSDEIEAIRDVDVDDAFTGAVMTELPARFPRRTRDRRGLKLAFLGGLLVLGVALGGVRGPGPGAVIPEAARPALLADVVDPALGGLLSLAQTLLMAVQMAGDTPWVSAVVRGTPWLLVLAATGLLATTAFCSAFVAVFYLGKLIPRS